ncbi:hypothetical protein ACSBR2_028873 [Camellia fascicularis]
MDFGRSKSKFQELSETGVSFSNVAGADQAKLELQEDLVVSPLGIGKTLLARAVTGEAGVSFFSCAASEFVELFVGVGASRVGDLFEKTKFKNALYCVYR